jgi:hypothetical protein
MAIKTSPGHRVCKYPECESILSIYNHEDYCNVHMKSTFWEDKVDGVPAKNIDTESTKVWDVLDVCL